MFSRYGPSRIHVQSIVKSTASGDQGRLSTASKGRELAAAVYIQQIATLHQELGIGIYQDFTTTDNVHIPAGAEHLGSKLQASLRNPKR